MGTHRIEEVGFLSGNLILGMCDPLLSGGGAFDGGMGKDMEGGGGGADEATRGSEKMSMDIAFQLLGWGQDDWPTPQEVGAFCTRNSWHASCKQIGCRAGYTSFIARPRSSEPTPREPRRQPMTKCLLDGMHHTPFESSAPSGLCDALTCHTDVLKGQEAAQGVDAQEAPRQGTCREA